ncbi:MAG: hypothetical protein HZA31_06725 [Opitutae bacterium]|nr:hypothetical protein [Opitutae bacterium]
MERPPERIQTTAPQTGDSFTGWSWNRIAACAVATNAELIVRLRPEGQKIALEISNPCQKKSDPAAAGALRPETWADLVRLDRGECTVVATQRHQQCTLKFPAEAEGLEPRHAPRKPL